MEAACAPHLPKLNPAPFATIIPDRRPPVKLHSGVGLAKLAVGYAGRGRARGGEIYKRTVDGWELLYRVESGTPLNELPWKESQ